MKKYTCPDCGFKPPIDKIYFIKNDKIKKRSMDDIIDFENDDNVYWPKINNMRTEVIDGMFDGNSWIEIHYCPNCKKEFSFENANF
jgi:hypothetical protein